MGDIDGIVLDRACGEKAVSTDDAFCSLARVSHQKAQSFYVNCFYPNMTRVISDYGMNGWEGRFSYDFPIHDSYQ